MFFVILISISLFASFRSDSGIVVDTDTNLQWQDDYTDNHGNIKIDYWVGALKYCKELKLEDYTDWRLPNIIELNSIVNRNRIDPAINSLFINVTTTSEYWSSTSNVSDTSSAWVLSFKTGSDFWENKRTNKYVRCVRGGY
jgi:hypothetical protein